MQQQELFLHRAKDLCGILRGLSSCLSRKMYPHPPLLSSLGDERQMLSFYIQRMREASVSIERALKEICSQCHPHHYGDSASQEQDPTLLLENFVAVRPYHRDDPYFFTLVDDDEDYILHYKKSGYLLFRDLSADDSLEVILHKSTEVLSMLSLEEFSMAGWGDNPYAYSFYYEARLNVKMALSWMKVFLAYRQSNRYLKQAI